MIKASKINFCNKEGEKLKFLDLNGKEIQGSSIADSLANNLSLANTKEPAKYMAWAYDLIKTGAMEIENGDLQEVKNFIINNAGLVNIAKNQMLEIIDTCYANQ